MAFKGSYGRNHPQVQRTRVLFKQMSTPGYYQPKDISPFLAYNGEYAL